MSVQFRNHYDGMRQVLTSPAMQAEMRRRAEAAASVMRGAAPVDSGEYRNSFDVSSGIREDGKRAVGRVVNTSDHAVFVEFGNGSQRGRYVMTNAIAKVGE